MFLCEEIAIAIDPASSAIFALLTINYRFEGQKLTSKELLTYYENLVEKYQHLFLLKMDFLNMTGRALQLKRKLKVKKFN